MKNILNFKEFILENFITEDTSGKKMSKEDFIKIAKQKWGDTFDYSKINYISSKDKIRLICKKHGPFNVKPMDHIKGEGCPTCSHSNAFNKLINQQGYIPGTVPEDKPFYSNKTTGKKLVHHKIGVGRKK